MSEQQRVVLAVALCLGILLAWQFLLPKHPKPKAPPRPAATAQETGAPQDTEAAPSPGGEPTDGAVSGSESERAGSPVVAETTIDFHTEQFSGSINNRSLALTRLDLPGFKARPPEKHDDGAEPPAEPGPVSLVLAQRDGRPYQAGITWALGNETPPAMQARELEGGGAVFTGRTLTGIEARVEVTPRENHFALDYTIRIRNDSSQPVTAGAGMRMGVEHTEVKRSFFGGRQAQDSNGVCLLDGGAERVTWSKLEDGPFTAPAPARWAGIDHQYFVVAAVPDQPGATRCEMKREGSALWLDYGLGTETLAPGATWERKVALYAGPKRDQEMQAVSPELLAVINYNIMGIPLGFIARPMIFLLDLYHGWVASWGVAIMLLTLTVKLLLFPVTYKSMVSMRKMQMLKPELDKIKERHPNDREKQQMAQLQLYKESGVNPLGGCLPMLLQMPVWFALYRSLWTAVDLYQEPFLWLPDLTAKEPGIPFLALGLGVVFFGQQLLTPMSADNQQMKIMKWVMPVMFTFFMLALPSGLVLYIFVNTVLSIFQQLTINRTLGPAQAMATAGTAAAGDSANGKRAKGGKRKAG